MTDSQRESAAAPGRGMSPGRRIGIAATTGVGAKALALAAQVLAVAIAVRTLGTEGFAVYVVIAALVSWIGLAGLGVAPGLTLGVARASALRDRGEEARLFVVALVLMAAIATLLVVCAVFLGATGLVENLLAEWLGSASGDASTALLCMALLIAVQLVVVVPEAAQLGLQSQYVSNVWAGIGSAAAIVAMVTVRDAMTSVTAFVLVSQGPQVAARAVNGILFVLGRRYLLRPEGLRFRQHARPILGSGIAFAGFSLASYVGLQVGLLIMAATKDAASVALAGVIVRGYTLQFSGLLLVTTPTWPAIANAVMRGDLPWVRRTYRVLALGALAYSSLVALAIIIGLEALIGIWTGTRPPDDALLRVLLAIFVVVNGWAHVNGMALVGLGALRFTAIVLVAEAFLVLALQIVFVPVTGVTGYVGALAVGAVTISGWLLPLRLRRALGKDARDEH
jgi:O-antigen/teichoic acid export membrane protein